MFLLFPIVIAHMNSTAIDDNVINVLMGALAENRFKSSHRITMNEDSYVCR